MKALLVLALICVSPCLSLAARFSFLPLSLQQRYLQDENSEMYMQTITSTISAAVTFESYQFGIEGSSWSTTSGSSLINYKNNFDEINTTHLLKMGKAYDWLYFYTGIGLGVYESELTSRFNGTVTKTKSGQIMMTSGIFSVQAIYKYLHVSSDFRLLLAKDYRPQPTPELFIKLGLIF